ncbi:armadillo repeat-containing protein 2-like [Antedon mediterranea]|uniref:armadillo repeat-containing protein 2-like n=1 Tax=Antedon mediterranea TaxID=105859 RepID=UPI003AF5BBD0
MSTSTKGSKPGKKQGERPFYEKQTDKETSSDIIKQARVSLRPVDTERPFTPQNNDRRLFPTYGRSNERPPSVFSLDSAHFLGSDSQPNSESSSRLPSGSSRAPSGSSRLPSRSGRPPSGGARLQPINHIPEICSSSQAEILQISPPKLPKPPGEQLLTTRSRLKLFNRDVPLLPQPLERRNSNPTPPTKSPVDSRRAHSGPKERTKNFYEERGEGEGAEQIRVLSAEACVNQERSQRTSNVSLTPSERKYSSGRTTKSGIGSRKEKESPEECLLWNTNILPIVEQLVPKNKETEEIDRMCILCDQLFSVLSKLNMLGRTAIRRSETLKIVYKLIDLDSAELSLKASRIVLAFEVTGSNLTSLCKLIFKISKNKENDILFQKNNILDLIVKLIASTNYQKVSDALIYCIGALKFLTGNNAILKDLADYGCTESLARLLININTATMEGLPVAHGVPNLLLQVTGTLRNLADKPATHATFISCQIIPELCKIIDTFPLDGDLMFNISRILSKLTLNQECCTILKNHPTTFTSFLMLMNKHLSNMELIVRLCFIMGNLTAKSNDCRYCLFNTENAMETLLSVFRTYLELDIVNQRSDETLKEKFTKSLQLLKGQKYEDIFIKLVRVIANLSINQDIGPLIAANLNCIELLLQILVLKDVNQSEELVLNTVVTINNLAYYNMPGSMVVEKQIDVCEMLTKLLMMDNQEGMVEATRVFGNLSRSFEVRDYISTNKVDEMMVTLLDSGNREIVYTACGVLINLMVDKSRRPMLKSEGGIRKLIDVLHDFGPLDWQLAGMVCMILCNYSENITCSAECLGEEETSDLIALLIHYLDEEAPLEMTEAADWYEDTIDVMKYYWLTDFYPVATQLISRIEKHNTNLVPLDAP